MEGLNLAVQRNFVASSHQDRRVFQESPRAKAIRWALAPPTALRRARPKARSLAVRPLLILEAQNKLMRLRARFAAAMHCPRSEAVRAAPLQNVCRARID